MFFKIFLAYILGYVKIEVEGYFIERFMNICISKNILLWNMKRNRSTLLNANISIKDFKEIKEIVNKTKCKVKIINKKGLPFLFHKYRKRKILVGLLVAMTMGIVLMSNFIWNIEIKCMEDINTEEIIEILNENGLTIGKKTKSIDTNKIINALRLQKSEIAWVGVDFKGTNVVVEIVKATPKPNIIKEDEFCNIISDKEGVITKINAQNGTAVVVVGDIVKNGTVLVNGWMEGKYTGIQYVHASAEIEAKVWYTIKEKIYKKQDVEEKTGNEETRYIIKFNNFQINLFKTLSKFQNYDTMIKEKKLKLFSDFYLPIELIKVENYETKIEEKTYSVNELKEMNIEKMEDKLKEEIGIEKKVVNKQMNIKEETTHIEIEIIYEVVENIGTEEKIMF